MLQCDLQRHDDGGPPLLAVGEKIILSVCFFLFRGEEVEEVCPALSTRQPTGPECHLKVS